MNFKRMIAAALSLCIVGGASPVFTSLVPGASITASAEVLSGECGENITWTFDESTGKLTISGTGPMTEYPVSSFGYNQYADAHINFSDPDVTVPWYDFADTVKSVVVGDGVETICEYAFACMYNVESITLPDSVTAIGKGAFICCHVLERIDLPPNITRIEANTFINCMALKEINIPDGVTWVGSQAFECCTSISTLWIPASVETFVQGAANRCRGLFAIGVDENNENYTAQDGVLFSKDMTELVVYPAGNSAAAYKIPESVNSLARECFACADNLEEVTIPEGVTELPKYMFEYCTGLTTVYFPSTLEVIEENAFIGCQKLTDVELNEGLKTIKNGAFRACYALKNIVIPESVVSVERYTFMRCTGISEVYVLNPDCELGQNFVTNSDPDGITDYYQGPIYGYKDSTAQTYAENHNVKVTFVPFNDILGDIDLNEIVDGRDASTVLTHYAHISTGKSGVIVAPPVLANADYDGNGIIDGLDASAILTYYAQQSVNNG